MTDSLFKQIPVQCPVLIFFLLHDFKTYGYPQILNVAGNRETLFQTCLIKLLKYNNSIVLLDIRGHHLTETDSGASSLCWKRVLPRKNKSF